MLVEFGGLWNQGWAILVYATLHMKLAIVSNMKLAWHVVTLIRYAMVKEPGSHLSDCRHAISNPFLPLYRPQVILGHKSLQKC